MEGMYIFSIENICTLFTSRDRGIFKVYEFQSIKVGPDGVKSSQGPGALNKNVLTGSSDQAFFYLLSQHLSRESIIFLFVKGSLIKPVSASSNTALVTAQLSTL